MYNRGGARGIAWPGSKITVVIKTENSFIFSSREIFYNVVALIWIDGGHIPQPVSATAEEDDLYLAETTRLYFLNYTPFVRALSFYRHNLMKNFLVLNYIWY